MRHNTEARMVQADLTPADVISLDAHRSAKARAAAQWGVGSDPDATPRITTAIARARRYQVRDVTEAALLAGALLATVMALL
ncbi:MAG TPA: hypothetical protein VGQ83_08120 [Polyangia bacterium]|jgi:hypothetical protein